MTQRLDPHDVSTYVLGSLPPAPARLLEVGAGSGELARALREAGYEVVAIDPEGEEAGVLPVALADFDEAPASFDAAVAVVSLHHVHPLEASCHRLAEVLRAGAPLVVDEFDVERFDERAAAWLVEQWHALGHDHEHEHEYEPRRMVADLRAELHSIAAIVEALEPDFEVGPIGRGSYLHRWDLDKSLAPVEEKLIAEGRLPAVGVRFVAVRRGGS